MSPLSSLGAARLYLLYPPPRQEEGRRRSILHFVRSPLRDRTVWSHGERSWNEGAYFAFSCCSRIVFATSRAWGYGFQPWGVL
jgi:hypothetical protein